PCSPRPCTQGRGAGGEGIFSLERQPPHPQPLAPEYRGEGLSDHCSLSNRPEVTVMNLHRTRVTALYRLALPALVLGLVACAAPTARADNIDAGLIKKAPEIVKYLKDHDYKNVGVLRFQLQKGKGSPTFSAGPING